MYLSLISIYFWNTDKWFSIFTLVSLGFIAFLQQKKIVYPLILQHVDCVILDDGGFLLMSNQDEYINLVSYYQTISLLYYYYNYVCLTKGLSFSKWPVISESWINSSQIDKKSWNQRLFQQLYFLLLSTFALSYFCHSNPSIS